MYQTLSSVAILFLKPDVNKTSQYLLQIFQKVNFRQHSAVSNVQHQSEI